MAKKKKKALKAKNVMKLFGGKKKVRKLLADYFKPAAAGATGAGAAAGGVAAALAKYVGKDGLDKLKEDGHTLVEMLRLWARGEYKDVSAKSMIVLTGSLAYFLSPVDLVPDWIPGAGQVDDAMIALFAIHTLQQELERFRASHGGGEREKKALAAVKKAA